MVPDRSVAASASAAASMSFAVFCSALIASDISGTGFDTRDLLRHPDIQHSFQISIRIFNIFLLFFFHLQFGTESLNKSCMQLKCSSSLVKPSALASRKQESSGSARASARSLPCAKCSCAGEDLDQ